MASFNRIAAFLIGSLSLILLAQPVQAQIKLNVCEKLVEDIFIPPVTREVLDCDTTWYKCLIFPDCCIPGVCKHIPHCQVWTTVEVVAGYIKHAGEVHCSFTDISAKDLLNKWVRNELTNVTNIILGGIPPQLVTYLRSDINSIRDSGHDFPPHVQQILREIVQPFYDSGHTGYAYNDITDVRIVSNRFFSAGKYLKDGKAAITLGPVIVFRDALYDQLTNPNNVFTLHDLKVGAASREYIEAIDVAAHEMVHVKQFRELGWSTFMTNYILEFTFAGYGSDNFEREAYTFGAKSSARIGGKYCEYTRDSHNRNIAKYRLDVFPLTCVDEYGIHDTLNLEVTKAEFRTSTAEFSNTSTQDIFLYVINHEPKVLKRDEVLVRLNGKEYKARPYDHEGIPVIAEGHSIYGSDLAPLNQGHLVVNIPAGTFPHCKDISVEIVNNAQPVVTLQLTEIGNLSSCSKSDH